MPTGLLHRLLRLSPFAALVAASPAVLLAGWYAWSAFAEVDRYRRDTATDVQLDAELFQLALYDQVHKDLRRLLLPDRPSPSPLPTFELAIDNADLQRLAELADPANPKRTGDDAYVEGHLRRGNDLLEARFRYRGEQHWHRLGAQKSIKVRLKRGHLLDGIRIFNLLNDPTPFGLEDEIIMDLARELGLLVPEYEPVWVRLNGVDMGVYRFQAQPTEGLLRRGGRMPGSIFSGESEAVDPVTGAGALFADGRGWKQVSQRNPDAPESLAEIERLLAVINHGSHLELSRYAALELDIERFAAFDALDVVFGGSRHDYLSEHRLYFDASKGRFEPIAASFRGFDHQERLNLVDHPLLLRLKLSTDYLARRDRQVYDLLVNQASVPAVRARVDAAFERIRHDLAADPHWDAYKLLPEANRFLHYTVRPMSADRWLLQSQLELATYARRNRFLLRRLEDAEVGLRAQTVAPHLTLFELTARGDQAWRLRGVDLDAGDCAGVSSLHADVDLDGRLGAADPRLAVAPVGERLTPDHLDELSPGVRLVAQPHPDPSRGAVWAERSDRTYRYLVAHPGCTPRGAAVVLESRVTGISTRRAVEVQPAAAAAPLPALPSPQVVPALVAGTESPHPWSFPPAPVRETVVLGPGLVSVPQSRVFWEHQSVELRAGTTLRLGPGASLVFRGPLRALGTRRAPIDIGPADVERPWGGVALQGRGTAGSALQHVRLWGGTHAEHLAIDYPGVLTVHDTADILLEGLQLAASGATPVDLLSATYVEGLRVYDLVAEAASADGIDLEHVTADLRGLRVRNAADECLDLMASTVRLGESILVGCGGNAVSAGEGTSLSVRGSVLSHSKTGVLAKNASEVRLSDCAIHHTSLALRTHRKEVHHAGESAIGAQDLSVIDCAELSDRDGGTRLDTGNVAGEWPTTGPLEHLRSEVLGLRSWTELTAAPGEHAP